MNLERIYSKWLTKFLKCCILIVASGIEYLVLDEVISFGNYERGCEDLFFVNLLLGVPPTAIFNEAKRWFIP